MPDAPRNTPQANAPKTVSEKKSVAEPSRAPLVGEPVETRFVLPGEPDGRRFVIVGETPETRFVLGENSENVSESARENAGKNPRAEQRSRERVAKTRANDSAPQTKSQKNSQAKIPASAPRRLRENPPEPEKETFRDMFFRKFGGVGFAASVVFHAFLIIGALLWIFSTPNILVEPDPDGFVSGAGGGRSGERPSFAEHSMRKRPKIQSAHTARITSAKSESAIALPEMRLDASAMRGAGVSAFGDGDFSSGVGGGKGGGIGSGTGIGVGGGQNFVGKFAPRKVLGANLYAEKIAVYLDCSGSMTEYLPQVKKEIYDKFPDADVFEFDGIRVEVIDGEVLGGRSAKMKKFLAGRAIVGFPNRTDEKKLSRKGGEIYRKHAKNFEIGSVGAWLDVMLAERYDALVVFSDFLDGLRQRDSKTGRTIFADSAYNPTQTDARKPRDLRWERDWNNAFRSKNAPRLYLFSIGKTPQKFWGNCVEISSGKITDVSHLRKTSTKTKKTSTKSKRKKKSAPAEIDVPENDASDAETDESPENADDPDDE